VKVISEVEKHLQHEQTVIHMENAMAQAYSVRNATGAVWLEVEYIFDRQSR